MLAPMKSTEPDALPRHVSWPPERFQILALDGGGIRGLYTASVLAALERDLGIRVIDHFDLITGTSTGGIIALGLALGQSPDALVEFYQNEGRNIFPRARWIDRWVRHLFLAKYSAKELERAVKFAFGDKKIGDATRALVVPAYNLDKDTPVALKTQHHPDFRRDPQVLAWKAAMATSAAPTYLPASADISGARYVDGGLWANNPALVGIIEAKRYVGVNLDAIRVLSIGTGNVIKERPGALTKGGRWAWRGDGVDVLFRAQGEGTQNQARLLLGDDRLVRVNPTVPESWKDLDVLRREYASQAAEDAKSLAPIFARVFKQHRALDLAQVRAGVIGAMPEVTHAR